MSGVGKRYLHALLAAVGMHATAAVALVLADVEAEASYTDEETEVAIEEPAPPIVPEVTEPEPEPEPEPPEPEPEPPKPEPEPKKIARVDPRPPPAAPPTAAIDAPSTDEPVEGAPSPVTPGGVFQMDDIAPAGTMKVGAGDARRDGPSGPGTGTGGGGTARKGPPAPVSIASIKKRAMPIGNTDYANLGKNYPAEALKRRIEGDVVVKLIVDAKGAVTSRKVLKGPGFGLNKRALSLSRKLRFKPAIDTNDKPVPSVVVWTFTFALPD